MERKDGFGLAIILLFGSSLRLFGLGNQSLWNDEAVSGFIAKGSVNQILTNQFISRHPPGYYLFLHYWQNLFGDSEFALRLPSAIAGIISLYVMYLLGRLLFSTRVGLWAAAITAVMPFHLFYSQEARAYALVFLFATLALLTQVKVWKDGGFHWWVAYTVTSILGLYLHYFFVFILATVGLYFVLRWIFKWYAPNWVYFVSSNLIILLAYSPMLNWIVGEARRGEYWADEVTLGQYISMPLSFTAGLFLPAFLIYFAFALILLLLIFATLQILRAIYRQERSRPNLILIVMAYWIPVTLIFVISVLWTPLISARVMIVAVPGLYLCLAWSSVNPREKVVNMALIISLIIIGVIADFNWLFNETYFRPAVRESAAYLATEAHIDEPIIYANDSGFRLFHWYQPQMDHFLYYDQNNPWFNHRVHPSVIRLIGGDVITHSNELRDTFWLVLHKDFDVFLQEDIYRQFELRYTQIEVHKVEGVLMYRYRSGP